MGVSHMSGVPEDTADSPLRRIHDAVRVVLKWNADDMLVMDFIVACITGSVWSALVEPMWGIVAGAPGTGKSEAMRPLLGWPRSLRLDDLTSNSLISGFKPDSPDAGDDEDKSMMRQLDGKIILMPDMTSMLGKRLDTLTEIMGQLRSAYDGEFSKWSGQRGHQSFKAEFGFLGACTPTIYDFFKNHQQLGQRFFLIRMGRRRIAARERRKYALRVMKAMQDKRNWRAELDKVVKTEVARLEKWGKRVQDIDMCDGFAETLAGLTDVAVNLRSMPIGKVATASESNNRFMQQAVGMTKSRALADGRLEVNQIDLDFAARIIHDTVPPDILRVARTLYGTPSQRRISRSLAQIGSLAHVDLSTLKPLMTQYTENGIVENVTQLEYRYTDDFLEQLEFSGTFAKGAPDGNGCNPS